jgi:5-methylcytosine-specific restriction enzyme subunit McrC
MILIQNIYHMLAYAFTVLKEEGYASVSTEEFESVVDLLAEILIKGIRIQLKRGLSREYVDTSGSLNCLRGKIDISKSVKQLSFLQKQLICQFDEFSEDSYLNRILKVTVYSLLRSNIKRKRKKELSGLMHYFSNVGLLDPYQIKWDHQFNKNNQSYQMLINICYLVMRGLIQKESNNSRELLGFMDESSRDKLFEKFVLNFYKKEIPLIKTSSPYITWDVPDGEDLFLPRMETDIVLEYKDKTLIIDTKFYTKTMQHNSRFDSRSIFSGNLYQIYTYVKNRDKMKTGRVSGLLLYARTDEEIQPDETYNIGGNMISVKTLDMNQKFVHIKKKLKRIVKDSLLS